MTTDDAMNYYFLINYYFILIMASSSHQDRGSLDRVSSVLNVILIGSQVGTKGKESNPRSNLDDRRARLKEKERSTVHMTGSLIGRVKDWSEINDLSCQDRRNLPSLALFFLFLD